MYKVAIAGANGKMGKIAQLALAELDDFIISALITSQDNLEQELLKHRPDILIDVTRPEFALAHARTALKHAIKPIIGTSGIKKADLKELQALNNNVGAIIAPNFSISAMLMLQFSELARGYFQHAEIIEEHHPLKLDAPSGTAIKTAELLKTDKIHSIRRPGVIAKQTILLANQHESLTIVQESSARESFIAGIKLACEQVVLLKEVKYLEQLLTRKKTENML